MIRHTTPLPTLPHDGELRISGLAAGYGGISVLDDVSLSIGSGEILALLGPNGAGKTTLIQTVAGFLRPLAGTVSIDNVVINQIPTHKRASRFGIGLVPDDRALIGPLTVDETLRIARPLRENPYELFPELVPLARRLCRSLSGGEQQILAISRALGVRPRFLLIDELSLGLAPMIVTRILDVLERVVADWGTSVLLVEQHVELALAHADHAAVMVDGRIRMAGTADEISGFQAELMTTYLGARMEGPHVSPHD
jgi:branched-chain amino acid transport system ATP-binding protein